MIRNGDFDTRTDFMYLQKWYMKALKMSLGQVREHIHQVKLSELQGFAAAPIIMPFGSECDEDGDSEMQDAPDTQETPSEVGVYDDAGFYIGEAEDDEDGDMVEDEHEHDGEAATKAPSRKRSWTDDGEDAIAEMADSDSSECESDDSSSSSEFNFHPSPISRRNSFDTDCGFEDGSLSNELRCLLLEIGGDPETARSEKEFPLTDEESRKARRDWAIATADAKAHEARRGRRQGETWAEMNILDEWDAVHGQLYWQTEGLFLCQLTELVYKNVFEQARKVFWVDVNKTPVAKKGRRRRENPPSSPLKNEHL